MKIKKQPGKKVPVSPVEVVEFVQSCLIVEDEERLATLLEPCLSFWSFPKSDLFHWTRLLDLFDDRLTGIIEECWNSTSKLQARPFNPIQRRLIIAMLEFTRMLLENCTSRNIYCSYDRLKKLLVTDDLQVTEKTLELLLIPARKLDSQSSLRATFEREIGTDEVAILGQLSLPFIPEMGELEEAQFALCFRDYHIQRLGEPGNHFVAFTIERLEYVKMLATAIFLMAQPEGSIDSAFFAMSPTLVADTAKLITPTVQGEAKMEIAALSILRTCLKSGSRCAEIVSALNLPASHGPIASIFRILVDAIVNGAQEIPFHSMFVYAFLDFVSVLTTQVEMDDTFVNSGVVAEAVRSVEALEIMAHNQQVGRYYKVMEKMLYILDALIHHYGSAIDFFFSNNGLAIIVHQVVIFINQVAKAGATLASHAESVMLQCLLRFIDKLLTTNGADDRLRNLLEGPYFRSLLKIFDENDKFAPEQVAYAISSVAAFIHNEPTSLSALQEMGVPQALCRCIGVKIPTISECIARLPNAFSALCLNTGGAEYFASINPVASLCATFLQSDYLKLLRGRGTASSLGTSIDEFIRHHPQFRVSVITDIIKTLDKVPAVIAKLREDASNAELFVGCDLIGEADVVNQVKPEGGDKRVEPILSIMVEALSAFIEGVIQSPNHAREFISNGGVNSLMEIFYSKGISYDFTMYNESLSLSHMLRILSDVDATAVISALFTCLKSHSKALEGALNVFNHNTQFEAILKNPDDSTRSVLNDFYHGFCSSLALIGLLKDLYIAQSSYGITRVNNFFVNAFESDDQFSTLNFILSILKKSIWELGLLYQNMTIQDVAGVLLRAKIDFKTSISYAVYSNALVDFTVSSSKSILHSTEDELKVLSRDTSRARCRNFLQLTFVFQRAINHISWVLHAISYKIDEDAISSSGELHDYANSKNQLNGLCTSMAQCAMDISQWLNGDILFNLRAFLMTSLMKFLPQISFTEQVSGTSSSGSNSTPRDQSFDTLKSNIDALNQLGGIKLLSDAVESFMNHCIPIIPGMVERDFELCSVAIKEMMNYFVMLSSPKMRPCRRHDLGRIKLRLLAFRFSMAFTNLPMDIRSRFDLGLLAEVVLCLANMVKVQQHDYSAALDEQLDSKDQEALKVDFKEYFSTVALQYLTISADLIPEVALMMRNISRESTPISRTEFDDEGGGSETEDKFRAKCLGDKAKYIEDKAKSLDDRAKCADSTAQAIDKIFGWLMSGDCPLSIGIRLRLLACSLGVAPVAKRYLYEKLIESIPSIIAALDRAKEEMVLASGLLLLAEIVYFTTLPISKPFKVEGEDLNAASPLHATQITLPILQQLVDMSVGLLKDENVCNLDINLSSLFLLTALTRKSETHSWLEIKTLIPSLVKRAVQCISTEDRRYRSLAILSIAVLCHLVETPPYLQLLMEYELLAANPTALSSRSRIKSFINSSNMDVVICRNFETFRKALVKHFALTWNDPEWEDPLEECMMTTKKQVLNEGEDKVSILPPSLNDFVDEKHSPNAETLVNNLMEELQKYTMCPPGESPQANEKGEEDPVLVQQHFSRCFLVISIAELVHSYPICRQAFISSPKVMPFLKFILEYMTPSGELAGTLGSRMFVNESMWVSQLLDEICTGPLQVPSVERASYIPQGCNLVVDALSDAIKSFVEELQGTMVVDYAKMSKAWCLVMTLFVLLSTKSGSTTNISYRLLSPSHSAITARMVEKGIMPMLANLLKKLDRNAPMAPIVAAKIIFSMEVLARMSNKLTRMNSTTGTTLALGLDEFGEDGEEEMEDEDEDGDMDVDEDDDHMMHGEETTEDEDEHMMDMEIDITEDDSSGITGISEDDEEEDEEEDEETDISDMDEGEEEFTDIEEDEDSGDETEEEIRLIIEPPVGSSSGPAIDAITSGFQVIPYDPNSRDDGLTNGARAWAPHNMEIRTEIMREGHDDEDYHDGMEAPYEWTEGSEDVEEDDGDGEEDEGEEDEDEEGGFEITGPSEEIFQATGGNIGDGLVVTLQPRFGGVGVGGRRRTGRFGGGGIPMEGVRFTSRGIGGFSSHVREPEVFLHPLVSPRLGTTSGATLATTTNITVGQSGRIIPFAERLSERAIQSTQSASAQRPRYENQEVFHAPAIVTTIRRWSQEAKLFLGRDISTMILEAAPEIIYKPLYDDKTREKREKELEERKKKQEEHEGGKDLSTIEDINAVAATTSMSPEPTSQAQTGNLSPPPPTSSPTFYEDMGPDREFLEALPFEMRREVLEQYFEERRRNIPDGAEVRINSDFLASLPADLRADYERLGAQEVERYRRRGHGRGWGEVDLSTLLHSMGPDVQRAIVEAFEAEIMEGGHTPGASGLVQPPALRRTNTAPATSTSRPLGAPSSQQIANLISALGQTVRRARESSNLNVTFTSSASATNTMGAPVTSPADGLNSATSTFPSTGTTASPLSVPKVDHANIIDINSLATILRIFFDPLMTEHRIHMKLFLHLSVGASTRADLLNMLIYILEENPEDLTQLETVLDTYCAARSSVSKSATPKSTPAKKKSPGGGKVGGGDPLGGSSYVVIQQRTAQLLMQLVQHSDEVRTFFTTPFESPWIIKRTDKKISGKAATISTRYPLVLLLACFEKHRFIQIPLLVESLLHLLQLVTIDLRDQAHLTSTSSTDNNTQKLEIPQPFINSLVKTVINTEVTPKAFQYATLVFQNLCGISNIAGMLVRDLAESSMALAGNTKMEMINIHNALAEKEKNRINETLKVISSPASNQAKLLRCMKMLSSCILKPLRADDERLHAFDTLYNEDKFEMKKLEVICADACWMELFCALDACLRSIGADNELLHVASGLLPAIESQFWHFRQMVVILPEQRQEEETFLYSFAERHRVLLNTMIRASPNLLTLGAFILLTKLPRTLDFDNKRSWFRQQLVKKGISRPSLSIHVRRAHVFEDSFHAVMSRSGDEIKYGRLSIKFHDEEGLDAGGVTREWFAVLSRQMFDPNYALFRVSAVDKITYQPNRMSFINPDHLQYFTFVGRIIGKAIYDNRLLDCYFTRSFYKHILGISVDFKDLEAVEPEFYKSLVWILENDITDVMELSFSMEVEEFGSHKIIDLIPDGRSISVTEANKKEYVKLVTECKLTTAIKPQIDAFLRGFHEIIPASLISIFNEQELELLISGMPDIDVDDWRNNTEYSGFTISSPMIHWFWRSVRSFDQEYRAKLLQFVTGTSKVPLDGFATLQGSSGVQRFQIHKDYGPNTRLPSAHTCFNQLDLPEYESYEQLREMLLKAINECTTGFGLA